VPVLTELAIVRRAEWDVERTWHAGAGASWAPEFHPIRKVVLHHTPSAGADADPVAAIRSIHRRHALDRGWGDIGYNLLVDQRGTVYEGRAGGSGVAGQDADGLGVTGAHVLGHNAGTVGIALIGTFDRAEPAPAALDAAAELIAWLFSPRGIDPESDDEYVNPVSGTRARFPNIAGHSDVADSSCPGESLYRELPELRRAVRFRMGSQAREAGANSAGSRPSRRIRRAENQTDQARTPSRNGTSLAATTAR
jgi:uncharacterized protein with LGFP repeats